TGIVSVPDARLDQLASIANSAKIIPTQLEFVDIAGLVKGASKGEGLGNQFLANIREVDAIVHVLRCFEDGNITHVEGGVDPVRDAEIIETELMLSDMESLQKRLPNLEKKVRSSDKEAKETIEIIKAILALLEDGKPARHYQAEKEQVELVKQLQLLTTKPVMYVCNVSEDDAVDGNAFTEKVKEMAGQQNAVTVVISAAIESEISTLEDEDKNEFLESLGLEETGLSRVIRAGYDLLDLITFFTIGPKEARAWTVKQASIAPKAAGVIHTDFERGFIRAETISFDDYITHKGEGGAKENGKMRLEGKDYIVSDGDIFHFRFSV
ncbi:MAG: redox-regulated ATPase YchF, partial [Rickettsiales bacterium]|nr:redox-regulated ATPase YchF [Rickettsiales bacterium]